MIIAISGKKQHGKDAVAIILQHLFEGVIAHNTLVAKVKKKQYIIQEDKWEVKRFAAGLKRVIATMTNCKPEDLESESFKNLPLFERYIVTNGYLNQRLVYDNPAEATLSYYEIYNTFATKDNSETINDLITLTSEIVTRRTLLTEIGTDIIHNVYPSFWIQDLMKHYNPNMKWIIADLRFPKEVQALRNANAFLIRVNRDIPLPENEHISETALDDYKHFDAVIDNNGSVGQLINKVKAVYEKQIKQINI